MKQEKQEYKPCPKKRQRYDSRLKHESSGRTTSHTPSTLKDKRSQFMLFVKILLKLVADSKNDALYRSMLTVVSTCAAKMHQRDRSHRSIPLERSLETALRALAGELYWQKARTFQRIYILKTGAPTLSQNRLLHESRSSLLPRTYMFSQGKTQVIH